MCDEKNVDVLAIRFIDVYDYSVSYLVSVAGASGYAGGEVLRLLAAHPHLSLGVAAAHTSRGPIRDHHRHLGSYADVELVGLNPERLAEADALILALPHGASGELTQHIGEINPDIIMVDLGADHRLTSEAAWNEFYGGTYHEAWTYGIPELIRAEGSQRANLAGARRIAGPGCNASAVTFAAQPAVSAGLVDAASITATLSVGYSGAGKSLKPHLLASEALSNLLPYGVGGTHRHIPEIVQNLRLAGGNLQTVSMTPVLAPVARGILAVVTMDVAGDVSERDVKDAYREAYAAEPFVRAVDEAPSTGPVTGSNAGHVYAVLDRSGERITAIAAIDNLVKGTAGAAIQSLNLALGLPETTGLGAEGVAP